MRKVICRTVLPLALLAPLMACTESPTALRPDAATAGSAAAAIVGPAADDLQLARSGTAPFHRFAAAEAARYEQVSPCIAAPPGAMGYHFARSDLYGDGVVEAGAPELLLYAPDPRGTLRLVGVEYQVFAAAWDPANSEPPSLFGQTFEDHRAEGATHGLPPHYELHAWIWRHNPAGMFTPFNPAVSC